MHQAMRDSAAQHETSSRVDIPEDPNESEKTPAPEPKEYQHPEPNPYLMSVSKDLRQVYQMIEMRNLAGPDFNYDHRMLIPKKTY